MPHVHDRALRVAVHEYLNIPPREQELTPTGVPVIDTADRDQQAFHGLLVGCLMSTSRDLNEARWRRSFRLRTATA